MALKRTITCDTCNKKEEVWFSGPLPPKTCHNCVAKAQDAELQKHLAALAKLPTKERLRKIEEWIYNHSKGHPRREPRF